MPSRPEKLTTTETNFAQVAYVNLPSRFSGPKEWRMLLGLFYSAFPARPGQPKDNLCSFPSKVKFAMRLWVSTWPDAFGINRLFVKIFQPLLAEREWPTLRAPDNYRKFRQQITYTLVFYGCADIEKVLFFIPSQYHGVLLC